MYINAVGFNPIGSEHYGKATLKHTPEGYESECTHCGTTNFSKDPTGQQLCKMCNKEYLAVVAHTEED